MHPIEFDGANKIFTKPQSMTDEQCQPVHAFVGSDTDNFDFVLTAWNLNAEDIAAVVAGRPLMLKILGTGMPPVALYTCDENGNANI